MIHQKRDQQISSSVILKDRNDEKNQRGTGESAVMDSLKNAHKHRDVPSRESNVDRNKVLMYYLEPPSSLINSNPLPIRRTNANSLQKVEFPQTRVNCSNGGFLLDFPTDEYPQSDPFLPWIHDYFVVGASVRFVAQNRRRCETGEGKETEMKFWEPQMALFQPVPIETIDTTMINGSHSNFSSKKYRLSSLDEATVPETRFFCRFHDDKGKTETTFSAYPFNYEYVNWRKHREQSMFSFKGPDVGLFEFSQLMFSCPIPEQFQLEMTTKKKNNEPQVWLDLIPIRTPARHGKRLLGEFHVGPDEFAKLEPYDTLEAFGDSHFLPDFVDSGRIANLPICPSDSSIPSRQETNKKDDGSMNTMHTLVVCTWTASSYHRRGDRTAINDAAVRLREWIVFHKLAGVDRIFIYDNSQPSMEDGVVDTSLKRIADSFSDFVTYHPWSAKVCNNNRPNHKNPGERSSQVRPASISAIYDSVTSLFSSYMLYFLSYALRLQYAAESSCRERYGQSTEWMAFIDTDEYLVPMNNGTWKDLLEEVMRTSPETKVLKMRSSRGRPREDLMEILQDQAGCNIEPHRKRKDPLDPCLVPRRNETFLRVYNCDYIKPPRPDRFARAMKQIYQPSFVLSHFVHYSTITTDIARYYRDWNLLYGSERLFSRRVHDYEWGDRFLNELNEGLLVHTKSVLPYETMTRSANCKSGKQHRGCAVGRVCPESTVFNDTIHQDNLFVDESGNFCNCWINQKVENFWVKRLEEALSVS